MRIYEFVDKYCQDIIQLVKENKELYDLKDLPNDGVYTDDNGDKIPYVIIDNINVPIQDIIYLRKDDFLLKYGKLPSASTYYDDYIETIKLIEGEDIIDNIRNQVNATINTLSSYNELLDTI